MLGKMKKALLALHKDEGGADMVEYVLLVALIGLPVLGIIWYFSKDYIWPWLEETWRNMAGNTAP